MAGADRSVSWKRVAETFFALVLALGLLFFFEEILQAPFRRNSLFALGFLILCGLALGRAFQWMGLPSLTGFLFAGVFAGPSGLQAMGEIEIDQLKVVNSLALALIALQAGAEFTKEMFFQSWRLLLKASFLHLFGIGMLSALGFLIAVLLLPSTGFGEASTYTLLALGVIFGSVAVSKSPAAVMAVLSETKIKNRLSEYAIGMVVILDIFVIVAFAFAMQWATSWIDPTQSFSLSAIQRLGKEVFTSIAAGTFFGLVVIAYLKWIDKERAFFFVILSFGVSALCEYLHYETLLVFVVAGFVVSNFSNQTEKILTVIEGLSSVVMIVFFATAGASLHLADVVSGWSLVLSLFLIRALATVVIERWIHRSTADRALKSYGFSPFVSQAGLSIGLSVMVADRVPMYGAQLATLMISVITLNEIFGPMIFQFGLKRSEAA